MLLGRFTADTAREIYDMLQAEKAKKPVPKNIVYVFVFFKDKPKGDIFEAIRNQESTPFYAGTCIMSDVASYHFKDGIPDSVKNMQKEYPFVYQILAFECPTEESMYKIESFVIVSECHNMSPFHVKFATR